MSTNTKTPRRIGIYSGTFDPVHSGHLSFALQAIMAADLDEIYFLPERRPRSKAGVEHFGHRVAMLQKAVKPHRQLKVLELEDVSFSVAISLPRLQKRFKRDELVFLVGSDVAQHLPLWPNAARLLQTSELVVGVREGDSLEAAQELVSSWEVQPRAAYVLPSYAADVSSFNVRQALRDRRYTPGLLKSVERYSDTNWLYVSLAQPAK